MENDCFPGQGKVREFDVSQGNLENKAKSGNFKFPFKWYGKGSLLKSIDLQIFIKWSIDFIVH